MSQQSASKSGSTSSPTPNPNQTPDLSAHVCLYCNKEFSNKSNLNQHRKIHLGPPDFNCTLCTFSTYQRINLDDHIRTHTKEKPFKCPHPNCSSAFSHASHLKSHQLVHSKDDERLLKFRCRVSGCSYKTGRKSNLKAHLLTHSTDKPFSCSLCPFQSKTKEGVKIHSQNVHSIEKPFKCPESRCKFSFKQKGDLNRHIACHSDERPFACCFRGCSYRARRKITIKAHERIHTGEKPFKCSFCSSAFTAHGNLVVHIRVHTGETPYLCQSCTYKTKKSSDLTRHVKWVHNLAKKSSSGKTRSTKVTRDQCQVESYKCQVPTCGFVTRENINLAIHLNTVHYLPRVSLVSCQTDLQLDSSRNSEIKAS